MWQEFSLKNFKGYQDTGKQTLRRLTVLIGPNGGGKSTLLQALLLLKQTAASPDVSSALLPEGDYVALGSFSDFVHLGEAQRKIRFYLRWQGLSPIGFEEPAAEIREKPAPSFGIEVELGGGGEKKTFVHELKYLDHYGLPLVQLTRKSPQKGYALELNFAALQEKEIPALPVRAYSQGPKLEYQPQKFYRFSPMLLSAIDSATEARIRSYPMYFERQLADTRYLGPLRESPKRYYVATGEHPAELHPTGAKTSSVLYADSSSNLVAQTSHWLRQLDIAEEVTLQKIRQADLYSLQILGKGQKYRVNLSDYGFGASQILPVVVESLFSPPGSTVMIEQPEIHLNAHHQLKLPDFFAELLKTSEKQFIIETHSEYFLKRLATLVAERRLSSSDVVVLYCYADQAGCHIRPIQLDDLGRFDDWPQGFLSEGFEGAVEHLDAMQKRTEGGQYAG